MNEEQQLELLPYPNIKLIDNEHINIYYYSELRVMHYIWKQRTIGEAYRKSFMSGAELAKEYQTNYFISDIKKQGVVGPDDRKWFETVAIPMGIELGLQKAAIVFDGNVFKKYYINMLLMHFLNKGVPMKIFNDLQSAEKWLLQS